MCHPLVLAVLQAAWRTTPRRSQPYYVGVGELGLPPDTDRNDAAITLAALSGWLTVGGDPPHSVAITSEGLALLKERGLAS